MCFSIAPVPTSRPGYRNSLHRDILTLITGSVTQAPVAERPVALPPVSRAERAMAASPEEFREFAQECLRWAGETKSERHRQDSFEADGLHRNSGLPELRRITRRKSGKPECGVISAFTRVHSPA